MGEVHDGDHKRTKDLESYGSRREKVAAMRKAIETLSNDLDLAIDDAKESGNEAAVAMLEAVKRKNEHQYYGFIAILLASGSVLSAAILDSVLKGTPSSGDLSTLKFFSVCFFLFEKLFISYKLYNHSKSSRIRMIEALRSYQPHQDRIRLKTASENLSVVNAESEESATDQLQQQSIQEKNL